MGGYIGVGGGVIFVPILSYFFSAMGYADEVLVKAVLANSLFAIIFTGGAISYKQFRMGNFFPREVIFTALPGMLTSLFMSWLIQTGTFYNKRSFAIVFCLLLVPLILKTFLDRKVATAKPSSRIKARNLSIVGSITGIISSLSGLGGGVVMIPAFTDILKMDIKKASSISTGVIPLFALPMSLYYMMSDPAHKISAWQTGYIIFPVIIPIILVSFLFSPLGVTAAHKSNPQTIRFAYGIFVLAIFLKMIFEIYSS